MQTQNFTEEMMELEGVMIWRTVYQIGDTFYCHIYNAAPGLPSQEPVIPTGGLLLMMR